MNNAPIKLFVDGKEVPSAGQIKVVYQGEWPELHVTFSEDGIVYDAVDFDQSPGDEVVGTSWETYTDVLNRLTPH